MMLFALVAVSFFSFCAAQTCENDIDCRDGSRCVDHMCYPMFFYNCPPNMHFEDCASTCQEKCGEPVPTTCNKMCFRGCVCNYEHVLDFWGKCVKREDCPQRAAVCGRNERFMECGTACEPSCENPNPRACSLQCIPNICQCSPGFVRHRTKGCVRQHECQQPICGRNEHFTNCGTACEPSCQRPNPGVCTTQCVVNVCQCNPGYYRHPTRGCVPLDHCRVPVCRANEHYTNCGTACEPSCSRPNPGACTLQCIPNVCQCNSGFYRHRSGACVPISQCMPTCGPNEHFTNCGTACEPSCQRPNPGVCTTQCIVNVCQCNPGYYRHPTRGCIPLHQCRPLNCGRNEHFTNCGTACEPSCEHPVPRVCTQQCIVDVCQCNQGFFRHRILGCVPYSMCGWRSFRN